MLDREFAHRKVTRVPGRERNRESDGCRGDQAVRLCKRHPAGRVIPAPPAGELAVSTTNLDDSKTVEQLVCRRRLAGSKPTMDLFDVDRRCPRNACLVPERSQPLDRARPATECVDEDRRVQEDRQGLADPGAICATLANHPGSGIAVPVVLAVGKASDGAFDVVPAPLVIEGRAYGRGDEGASATTADPAVEVAHEIVIQAYVQTHDHTLTHKVRV